MALSSYDNIPADRKTYLNTAASLALGQSVRRFPDGGAWDTQAAPTYADCNGTCIDPGTSSCTGTGTVNPSGGTPPYTYAWDDSQLQSTQTAVDLCAGTYTVTVTDALGETVVVQATVADFVPTVSVNIQAEICVDANPVSPTVTPVAGPGQTGTLSGPGVSSNNFNPTTAGIGDHTISYYYEDEFGCSNSAPDQIIVFPLPVLSITNNQSPYCLSDIPADLILSPAGGELTGVGVVNNQFIPSQAGVGTFTLTYYYIDINGCDNTITASVQVTAPPSPTLVVPSDVCIDGSAVTMVANPTGGNFQIDGQAATNQFVPSTEGAGNHTVTYVVTDGNGCIASTSENIIVHNLPNLAIPTNANYCFETGFYAVTATPAGGVLSGDLVSGNGINVTGAAPGTYSLTYTYSDPFGCSNTTTQNFNVTTPLQPSYTYTTNCFQGAIFTSSISNANYTYNWNIANTNIGTGIQYATTFATFGDFPIQLAVTDNFGCTYDSIGVIQIEEGAKIEDLAIPNVISPNGDGVNDYFEMPQLLNDCFTYKIFIVNRWGNVVYEMDTPTSVFSGQTQKGADLEDGVYFYSIESDDFDCNDEKYKGFCYGNISIFR